VLAPCLIRGGWVGGWGRVDGASGLRLPFRQNGTSYCAKGAPNGLQTTIQTKVGQLITVMDNWEQFNTNATLLKPAKHCHNLIRALQGHEKVAWKSRLGYLQLFCCGVWIVHKCSYIVSQLKGFQFLCIHAQFLLDCSRIGFYTNLCIILQ